MNHSNIMTELTPEQIDAVSGGDETHYESGKALADAIQDATHRFLEWARRQNR